MEDINIGMQEEMKTSVSEKQPEGETNTQENISVQCQNRFDYSKANKLEYSKIAHIFANVLVVWVTAFTMAFAWKNGSSTVFVYLIPAVFAYATTTVAFYFDKAKKENLIKLRCIYGDDLMDKVKGDSY
ncbi:MAG: hypothetical protein LUC92_08715 [Clostridiales bacterium]|nr:hypothetical protein [Clostridiales bacterium]